MADITQSFSQLLLTYGPGAMLDLPDQAVIVSGLQGWRYGPSMKTVAEDRLIALLRDQLGDKLSPTFSGLRQPPEQDEDRRDERAPGVEVLLFPSWFTVDEDADPSGAEGDKGSQSLEKRRRMVEFEHLTVTKGGKLSYKGDKKRREVNPIRFVAACTKGHLQDIDWRFLVHRNGDRTCRKAMYWVERGVSSDPSDISVRCTCGAMLTMADLYKPKFLGTCRAESPWLQPQRLADEGCGIDLRLLPRSATNTYFAQTVTVISLTNSDDRARQTVQEHRPTIDSIRALTNFLAILRSLPNTKDAFSEFTDEEILRALDEETGEVTTSANPRIAEFDILASGARFIGHDGPTSHLFAETLSLDDLVLKEPWRSFLTGVVKVHRLREVTCLYGFTRLEPPPTAAESELDEIQLAVDGADLARNVEWLPAIEQYGEGIFLHVDPDFLNRWRAQGAVGERTLTLREGEAREAESFGRPPSHLGIAYWALHSLSHALMSELSLECGYPLSSLKERVYSSGAGQADRYGLLIYTSTAGGQGTLGGLSGMAHRVGELLSRAVKRLALCSNDPICAEHSPVGDYDDRHLHGAACHACLLIPETSCEARNTRLDRGLLVPTVVGSRYACFEVL
ncbi:DrmB family protein [Rhizobium sp. IMFF44]|uniref:DrmB family protein n=1 Tax=Rhizobium sp. IMFF44 TaxID=3342350 RepID=UPI0035B6BB4F